MAGPNVQRRFDRSWSANIHGRTVTLGNLHSNCHGQANENRHRDQCHVSSRSDIVNSEVCAIMQLCLSLSLPSSSFYIYTPNLLCLINFRNSCEEKIVRPIKFVPWFILQGGYKTYISSFNYRTLDDCILFDEINDKKIYWKYSWNMCDEKRLLPQIL